MNNFKSSNTEVLHNSENRNSYNYNTDNFKNAVTKTLGGNTFDVAIRLVNTTQNNNVTLRIKNVNSEFSQFYKDAVIQDPAPVIFSGGLFSDLERWEQSKGLAKQLAEEGRDSWEIEITGGPLIERNTDPNYSYDDLVDEYWPASIAAIQYYTGKITTQYVSHSNGCRVALSSLEKYQQTGKNYAAKIQNLVTGNYFNAHLQGSAITPIVDTFVGVGCPGAFVGESPLITTMQRTGNNAIANLEMSNKYHLTLSEAFIAIAFNNFGGSSGTNGKISLNLFKDYKTFIENTTDLQPGNFTTNRTLILYGKYPLTQNDFIVTEEDSIAIVNKINSNNKIIGSNSDVHFKIVDSFSTKDTIKRFLRGEL